MRTPDCKSHATTVLQGVEGMNQRNATEMRLLKQLGEWVNKSRFNRRVRGQVGLICHGFFSQQTSATVNI